MDSKQIDEYISDQKSFDTDVIWFGIVPPLAFCAIVAIMKLLLVA